MICPYKAAEWPF